MYPRIHVCTYVRMYIRTCFWDARRIFLENPAKRVHTPLPTYGRDQKKFSKVYYAYVYVRCTCIMLSLSLSISVNFSLFLSIYPSICLFFFFSIFSHVHSLLTGVLVRASVFQ